MKIYQVILGVLPEYLNACVESVVIFADKYKYELIQIKSADEQYDCVPHWQDTKNAEYFRNRIIKDWISLDILSTEKQSLFIDWDIYLNSKKNPFIAPEGKLPILSPFPFDSMMFNGDDLESFKKIKEYAGNISDLKPGQWPLHIGFGKYNSFKYKEFDNKTFKHLANSLTVQ